MLESSILRHRNQTHMFVAKLKSIGHCFCFGVMFLILGSTSFAQQPPAPPPKENGKNLDNRPPGGHDPQKEDEIRLKRQAELQEKLKLSTEQKAAWLGFIQSLRPDNARAEAQASNLSAIERTERELTIAKKRQTDLERKLSSLRKLYGMLSAEQKRLFDQQFPAIDDQFAGGKFGPPPLP